MCGVCGVQNKASLYLKRLKQICGSWRLGGLSSAVSLLAREPVVHFMILSFYDMKNALESAFKEKFIASHALFSTVVCLQCVERAVWCTACSPGGPGLPSATWQLHCLIQHCCFYHRMRLSYSAFSPLFFLDEIKAVQARPHMVSTQFADSPVFKWDCAVTGVRWNVLSVWMWRMTKHKLQATGHVAPLRAKQYNVPSVNTGG